MQADEEVAETSKKLEDLQGASCWWRLVLLCIGRADYQVNLTNTERAVLAVSGDGTEPFGEKKKKKKSKVRLEDAVRLHLLVCLEQTALTGFRKFVCHLYVALSSLW